MTRAAYGKTKQNVDQWAWFWEHAANTSALPVPSGFGTSASTATLGIFSLANINPTNTDRGPDMTVWQWLGYLRALKSQGLAGLAGITQSYPPDAALMLESGRRAVINPAATDIPGMRGADGMNGLVRLPLADEMTGAGVGTNTNTVKALVSAMKSRNKIKGGWVQ
jgi:hypothetical protein